MRSRIASNSYFKSEVVVLSRKIGRIRLRRRTRVTTCIDFAWKVLLYIKDPTIIERPAIYSVSVPFKADAFVVLASGFPTAAVDW